MSIIITGAAGFIGSCLVTHFNKLGYNDVIVVDQIESSERWKLLSNKQYSEYIPKNELIEKLPLLENKVEFVIHMGACSSTTELDFDYLHKNNVVFSQVLWNFCAKCNIPFIYASSAATYGDGLQGFSDKDNIDLLRPLNGYGYSKQMFDKWVLKQNLTDTIKPSQCVGLKFFNVYGPNEYYKDDMASVVFKSFHKIDQQGYMELFKSHKEGYINGGQRRDFIYVKDICNVVQYLIQTPSINGLFNLGTGKARPFVTLTEYTFDAMNIKPDIRYIDMPLHLREKYQYFTEADMSLLISTGYDKPFYSLREGVTDYVQNYLMKDNKIY